MKPPKPTLFASDSWAVCGANASTCYLTLLGLILNESCYHAFRGRLLFSRDEAARCALVERTIALYLDRKPILEQALKEAMSA